MSTGSTHNRAAGRFERLLVALAGIALAVAIAALLDAGSAPAQTLQEKFDDTQSKLNDAKQKEGVLTTQISSYSDRISRLEGEVAALRNREAVVAERLAAKQAQLERAQMRLAVLRARLKRAIAMLEQRLVEIYKSGEPDVLTVLLNSDGFDDLVVREEYLQRLEDQDSSIVGRVRELRNEMQQTVDTVKKARDAIARQKQQLERTRATLESRTAALSTARQRQESVLADVRSQRKNLEGDLSDISKRIQEQLGSGSPLPAGPIQQGSGMFIWPVNGPVVSGFGMRWGSMHEGVDIAVPTGTPIRAAAAGTIVLAAYTGGYGNYTCIDHGGGLSTCYAHQESYARTSGHVSQGTVIGYTDCTGHCFGPHLHFEVRVNGTAVDPLGYL